MLEKLVYITKLFTVCRCSEVGMESIFLLRLGRQGFNCRTVATTWEY